MRAASAPDYDGPANLRRAVAAAAAPELRGAGAVVVLSGSIEPADDVTKTHTLAFDTFRSLNSGSLGRVDGDRVVLERARGPRRHVTATSAAERVHLVTATVAMDGTPIDALRAAGADGFVVAATGAGNTAASLLAAAERAMADGPAGRADDPVAVGRRVGRLRVPRRRGDVGPGRGDARGPPRRTEGAGRARAGPRRGAGSGRPSPRCWPIPRPRPWHARPMPLEALVTGRIATLAGDAGFGWVEAVGISRGRVAFAGSAVELETRADPFTVRFELDPDEVAIPGLTDAHLHLAEGGIARDKVDLSQVPSLAAGLAAIRAAGRGPARRRALDRGPRLGPGPVGPLADRRRPRGGRARTARRDLGPRPPLALGEPRGARGRRDRPRHRRPRRRPHPSRRRRRAERRPPRIGGPARDRPRAGGVAASATRR